LDSSIVTDHFTQCVDGCAGHQLAVCDESVHEQPGGWNESVLSLEELTEFQAQS
jgi:hypothetical protein